MPDDHGDEHDGIVKKVEFDARKNELENADGHRLAPEIMVYGGLGDQQQVLDVMPELNDQCNRPPLASGTRKSFAQDPDSDQHHQRITIMEDFGLDQPRIPQT